MFLRIAIFFILFCVSVEAKHLYPEKYYQNIWCSEQKGLTEVKLLDDTRIDCLTKTHAVEFDFASKWAEAIGQSLHYSRMSGKLAGIVLIVENNSDYKYYNKIKPLCEEYNISLWSMSPPEKYKTDDTDQFNKILRLLYELVKNILSLFLDWIIK